MNVGSIGGVVELIVLSMWRCFLQLFSGGSFGLEFKTNRPAEPNLLQKHAASLWVFCSDGVLFSP
jgi:hypothetical protein